MSGMYKPTQWENMPNNNDLISKRLLKMAGESFPLEPVDKPHIPKAMTCKNCGAPLGEDMKCDYCGTLYI